MHTEVAVDGVRSPVLQAGPADAHEAVVFLHGNPGSGHDWDHLLAPVGQFARAVAPDMPGYGAADKPADFDYSNPGYAAHLDGLLERLGIRRAHLVLHDFGGGWGLTWATEHPQAFASVTLINTGALVGYRWHRYARIWRTPVLGALFMASANRPSVRAVLKRENPKLPREALDRIVEQSVARETKRAALRLYRAAAPEHFEALVEPLRALDRPALVIWGDDDAYVPPEQADRQRQSFPSAEVHHLEGHGHWPFLEDPDRVADLVVPFLRAQLAPEPLAA